jgi:hypothetical protein
MSSYPTNNRPNINQPKNVDYNGEENQFSNEVNGNIFYCNTDDN